MPEQPPVGTGTEDPGSPSGSPGTPTPVATGDETVPKERFDGLMSSYNKVKDEHAKEVSGLRAQVEELSTVVAKIQAPPSDVVTRGEAQKLVESAVAEARGRSDTVYEMYRESTVAGLLAKYPFASASAVTGSIPADWEASIRAEHERVAAIVEKEAADKEKAIAETYRKQYGAPLGVGGGGGPAPAGSAEEAAQRRKSAIENRDSVALARELLLAPIEE